ncbi:hypothetical protein D3C80_1783220 [compost metagenome]
MAEQLQGLFALALGDAEAGHVGEADDVAYGAAFGVGQWGGRHLQHLTAGGQNIAEVVRLVGDEATP